VVLPENSPSKVAASEKPFSRFISPPALTRAASGCRVRRSPRSLRRSAAGIARPPCGRIVIMRPCGAAAQRQPRPRQLTSPALPMPSRSIREMILAMARRSARAKSQLSNSSDFRTSNLRILLNTFDRVQDSSDALCLCCPQPSVITPAQFCVGLLVSAPVKLPQAGIPTSC
jgi:hypothetical protein